MIIGEYCINWQDNKPAPMIDRRRNTKIKKEDQPVQRQNTAAQEKETNPRAKKEV
jgi:hypothetical protein